MADPAWGWCISVDAQKKRVKCKYCDKEMNGGSTRLKHHLAGTRKEEAPCKGRIPKGIKWQRLQMIEGIFERNREMRDIGDFEEEMEGDDVEEVPTPSHMPLPSHAPCATRGEVGGNNSRRDKEKRVVDTPPPPTQRRARGIGGRSGSPWSRGVRCFFPPSSTSGAQQGIRSVMASDDMRLQADYAVGRWFYDACIPFNTAHSFHFEAMADAPLVKVLRLADSEERPSIGYIYEAMDQAKEAIKINFRNRRSNYMPIWKIIDSRWSNQLHQNIHGHYLNPQFRYSASFVKDSEVTRGIIDSLDKLVGDPNKVDVIYREMHVYDHALRTLGLLVAIRNRNTMRPDMWWEQFGIVDCPNLSTFAIWVLSQTCSASACERNWSVFEQIHTKKRNRLEHKRLNDLVFIRCNMRLRERQLRRSPTSRQNSTQFDSISLDNLYALEEWVEEEEDGVILTQEDVEWINLEGAVVVDEEDVVGHVGDEGDGGDDHDGDEEEEDYYEGDYYLVDPPADV